METYDGEIIQALALIAVSKVLTKSGPDLLPSKRYLSLLIMGARYHNLDGEYIRHLTMHGYTTPKLLGILFVLILLSPALPFWILTFLLIRLGVPTILTYPLTVWFEFYTKTVAFKIFQSIPKKCNKEE